VLLSKRAGKTVLTVILRNREINFMLSAERALIDLKTPLNRLAAGRNTLLASIKELQASAEGIEQALATIDAGRIADGLSPAALETSLETARAQLRAASAGILRAKTAVRTLRRAVFSMGTIAVEIFPATAIVDHYAAVQFSALGDSFGYIWSLNPAEGKGTVDQTGHYTAPGLNGSVKVIATSKTDSSKAAAAQVTIHKKDIPPAPRRRRPPRRPGRSIQL
jgi:hypothetical protein